MADSAGRGRSPLSVATLVRDRNAMLGRLVDALAAATPPPGELLVAWCGGEDPAPVLDRRLPFDVSVLDIGGGDRIAYAPARNACAAAARFPAVAFLDADCIPAARYPAALADALAGVDALCTGEVWYLPPEPPPAWDEATLRTLARPHPHRQRPPEAGVRLGGRHELVWGLHLALRRSTFHRLGGFDEGYGGYAGEDTDLAVTARQAGVAVALVAGAQVFHQHHDAWEPPVQQLEATMANATRFHHKWGWWPMGGWLGDLAAMGLIEWRPDADHLTVVRPPTDAEVAAAHRDRALPFRSGAS